MAGAGLTAMGIESFFVCSLGLLGNIFSIFRDAREPPGYSVNPGLMPFDKDFKRVAISTLAGDDKRCIFFVRRGTQKRNRWCLFVLRVYDFW
jgi:hypothetical protein